MTVYEASGGARRPGRHHDLDGYEVDRFYHVLLPTDDRVLGLAEELGLRDAFRFRPLGVGFFHDGRLASMSTPRELLRFPGLSAPTGRGSWRSWRAAG